MKRPAILLLCAMLFGCALVPSAMAQRFPNSPVFRNYRPPKQQSPSSDEALARHWNDFMLMRDANSGNADAQHELGLRHLTGEGFLKDTSLAALWIGNAAAQRHITASYNYALLHLNGWGVRWNPFEAFRLFHFAADEGMAEAQYILGLLYTDNLIIPRDWKRAASWLSSARRKGDVRARQILDELLRRAYITPADTTVHASIQDTLPAPPQNRDTQKKEAWSPVFLDFDRDTSQRTIDAGAVVEALVQSAQFSTSDSLALVRAATKKRIPTDSLRKRIERAGELGNGSALCVRGILSESDDPLFAAELYIRAGYLDSPYGLPLLAQLLQRKEFLDRYQRSSGSAREQFIGAMLFALGIDRRLTEGRALQLLREAANAGHEPALVQLGLSLITGRWQPKNSEAGFALWKQAIQTGSMEARVRLLAEEILSMKARIGTEDLSFLSDASDEGSALADVALGYAREHGIGFIRHEGEAVRYYRKAAQQGSRHAWERLVFLYDRLRPDEDVFRVER